MIQHNPYKSPGSCKETDSSSIGIARSHILILIIAAILVVLNPLPVIDFAIGGFAAAAVSGRLPFDLSFYCGCLGVSVAIVFNYVVLKSGGSNTGAINLQQLSAEIVLFGGVGVMIGVIFKYSTAKNPSP